MADMRQDSGGDYFRVFSLYDDTTMRLIRADIEAESLPERGDIICLEDGGDETITPSRTCYKITGMLYLPNSHGFLHAQLLGERLRGWPMVPPE